MSQEFIRVGIAGFGRSGCDIHAKALSRFPEKFKIVAVADQLQERREDAARDYDCQVFADYEELIENSDFDLFINALPSYLHTQGTVQAFKAGKHVVCEKPLAASVKDFDKMVKAAKKTGKIFAPFQNYRFFELYQKIREILDSGVLGEILHVRLNFSGFGRRWDWQTLQKFGGGNLSNTGPHPLDQAVLFFDKKPPKVFCRMRSIQPLGGDAEDFCALTLYRKNSPLVEVLLSSYLAYPQGEQYNISGSNGGLTGGPGGLKWKYFDPAAAPKQEFWKPWSIDRGYCKEELPWHEESWTPTVPAENRFSEINYEFYKHWLDVFEKGATLIVKPKEVRRQIAVIEECRRQNPLPIKIK